MNSLLTFRGQVLLSKATAFFILRDFGNACLRRLFLLYLYLSIHPPNAKANKTVLYFRWHYSLFNVAAAYCNSTFPLCHLLREACLLNVQCQCLHLFIIVLVRLNWSFPFFMSASMCSPSWLMLMINICNGSLHSPDTVALITALYSVVYVFRKPTFRYLLFMRLFWICSSEATHFFNANLAWCCDNCHYLVRSLRCDQ